MTIPIWAFIVLGTLAVLGFIAVVAVIGEIWLRIRDYKKGGR